MATEYMAGGYEVVMLRIREPALKRLKKKARAHDLHHSVYIEILLSIIAADDLHDAILDGSIDDVLDRLGPFANYK